MFTFGDAAFHGSLGSLQLNAPIVAIAATPSGNGYWLVGADGGVFAFGDAAFHGAATGASRNARSSAWRRRRRATATTSLGADGGVFAFGDAALRGAAVDAIGPPATASRVAATARATGSLAPTAVSSASAVAVRRDRRRSLGSQHPVVGIAARAQRRLLDRAGQAAPAARGGRVRPSTSQDPFLACTRAHESRPAGGYHAVSPAARTAARTSSCRRRGTTPRAHAGRPDLVGVDPAAAAPADQDLLALDLYHVAGCRRRGAVAAPAE